MNPSEPILFRAARWCAFGSAVSVMFSIAASQIFLALAVVALLFSGAKLRLPPVTLPLGLFLLGTLISLFVSGNIEQGLPQVRKFFVFLELLVVYSTLREMVWIRRLFLCWGGAGAIIALRGCVQFAAKWQQAQLAGRDFYEYYVAERITGFMSHWMTFSGEEMLALIMLAAFILFAAAGTTRLWLWGSCSGLMAIALYLGETRSIWLACGVAGLYLTWCWNRKLVFLVPLLALVMLAVSPATVRARFTSILQPRGQTDSNQHRIVTWRTGLNIIRQHPWFGLGPEGPKYHFNEYVPSDITKPLPEGYYGHLHNIYLQFAAERGVPTMLMMLWFLLQIVYDFWRKLQTLPPGRGDFRFLLHGGIACVIAIMVAGLAEHNLGDSEVLAMFLAVVACGYIAVQSEATV
jgi:putative inorganic carbon (hco3(-)) transporter